MTQKAKNLATFAILITSLICCIKAQTYGDITFPPYSFKLGSFLTVNYEINSDNTIVMAIKCTIPNQYFSIGIGTSMYGSDMWIFQIVNSKVTAGDYYSPGETTPVQDSSLGGKNDLLLLGYQITSTYTLVKVKRALNTGDAKHDKTLQPGLVSFIYATGHSKTLTYHGSARGEATVTLVGPSAGESAPTGEEAFAAVEEFGFEEQAPLEEEFNFGDNNFNIELLL